MEAVFHEREKKRRKFCICNWSQVFYYSTILCFGRSLFLNKTNFSIGIHLPLPLLYKYGSTFVLSAWSNSAYCLVCVALFIISTNKPPPERRKRKRFSFFHIYIYIYIFIILIHLSSRLICKAKWTTRPSVSSHRWPRCSPYFPSRCLFIGRRTHDLWYRYAILMFTPFSHLSALPWNYILDIDHATDRTFCKA